LKGESGAIAKPVRHPHGTIVGVEDHATPAVAWLAAFQHVALNAAYLVYPILLLRAAGVPVENVAEFLSAGMLVLGLGTMLQGLRLGPVGAGYLCPSTFTATYIAPGLLAVSAGGLPLLCGMLAFAGVIEMLLSRVLYRLRAFLPTEIAGLVVFMVGVSSGMLGLRYLVGGEAGGALLNEWLIAVVALAVMVVANVWGRGWVRMGCALLGLACGYLLAAGTGLMSTDDTRLMTQADWFGVPKIGHVGLAFDPGLILPFAIGALAATLKAVGGIVMCQRTTDADWVRPASGSLARGVLADGLTTTVAGLCGTYGTNVSTSSVALAAATGVTARRVALQVGIAMCALSVSPKVAAALAIMPRPVMVGVLLFAVCFIMVSGLQMMTSRLLDARRTLVLGLAIVGGLGIEALPAMSQLATGGARMMVGSSLVFAVILALTLNLIFRIGVRRRARIEVEIDRLDPVRIQTFFQEHGASWGARPETVARAAFAVSQSAEVVADGLVTEGPIAIEARYDEFDLDVTVRWRGRSMQFPDARPTDDDIRDSDDGAHRLAGWLLRHNADRATAQATGDRCSMTFRFEQ